MLNKLSSLTRRLLSYKAKPPATGGPVLFDTDVFLVSYPKSGNTWLRFLLANYITGGRVDLNLSNHLIPDIYYNPEDINETLNPRIMKSHERYTPKYKRVVYIVRDGRDVAVSYYYYLKKFKQISIEISFSEYLDDFISGKLDGFGLWGLHVEEWISGSKDLLLIRYEDMLADTESELKRVIQYCNLEFAQNKLVDSVSACSLNELREIEKRQFNEIKGFSTSDPAMYFFRKGISGDWKNYFTEQDKEKFYKAFSKTLTHVGYAID